MLDHAGGAAAHERAQLRAHGVAAELVVHEVHNARIAREVEHLLRFGGVAAEGLVA